MPVKGSSILCVTAATFAPLRVDLGSQWSNSGIVAPTIFTTDELSGNPVALS
jgi:hypothetical protein